MEKLLLTIDEAADTMGVSYSHMSRLLLSGRVASLKIGALRRIPVAALESYISSATEGAA